MESFQGHAEATHRPLSASDPSEIRLVKIHAANFDDPVCCELEHASLDSKPLFWTLSYTWGDPKITVPIYLNGQEYPVTTNLESFLRHFQAILKAMQSAVPPAALLPRSVAYEILHVAMCFLPTNCLDGPQEILVEALKARVLRPRFSIIYDRIHPDIAVIPKDELYDMWAELPPQADDPGRLSMYIWIDAICINQSDTVERSREVSKMRDIYSKSSFLTVWLGSSCENTKEDVVEAMDLANTTCEYAKEQNVINLILGDRTGAGSGAEVDIQQVLREVFAGFLEQNEHHFKSFITLLNNSWFRRIWCVQEIALVQSSPVILYGFNCID